MKIAIGILAKDEEAAIGATIVELARQTVFDADHHISVIVVPNGCSDRTGRVAQAALANALGGRPTSVAVHETALPGKSRAWNLLVHDLAAPDVDMFVFVDADIRFARDTALADLLATLTAHSAAAACSGKLMKDIAIKPRKSLVDRFSLAVSAHALGEPSVNGSLYAIRGDVARTIWLPVPTPGEDGFLNAMVNTDGFTKPHQRGRVVRVAETTHYFEATTIAGYLAHERRMIVGTTINRWLFEHLMALEPTAPVGSRIRDWNASDPDWVQKVIDARTRGRRWVLPPALLTWRLHNLRGVSPGEFVRRAPFSIAATLLNVAPALAANQRLKRQGAGKTW